jgi:hypothetical protein
LLRINDEILDSQLDDWSFLIAFVSKMDTAGVESPFACGEILKDLIESNVSLLVDRQSPP